MSSIEKRGPQASDGSVRKLISGPLVDLPFLQRVNRPAHKLDCLAFSDEL